MWPQMKESENRLQLELINIKYYILKMSKHKNETRSNKLKTKLIKSYMEASNKNRKIGLQNYITLRNTFLKISKKSKFPQAPKSQTFEKSNSHVWRLLKQKKNRQQLKYKNITNDIF